MLSDKQEIRLNYLREKRETLSVTSLIELEKLELLSREEDTTKIAKKSSRKVTEQSEDSHTNPDLVIREYFVIYKGYLVSSHHRVLKLKTLREIKVYPQGNILVVQLTIRGKQRLLSLTKLVKELFPKALIIK